MRRSRTEQRIFATALLLTLSILSYSSVVVVVPDEGSFDPSSVSGLWTWADAEWGDNNSCLTHEAGNPSEEVIDTLCNRADPGTNDYYNNDSQDSSHYRPGYQEGFSASGYSTSRVAIGLSQYTPPAVSSSAPFGQYMYQSGNLGATGEFYMAIAVVSTRTSGDRYLLGTDASNHVRWYQTTGQRQLKMEVANGGEVSITPSNSHGTGAYLWEIWRDGSNDIYVRQTNGSGSTTYQEATISGTFAPSGFGGGSFNTSSSQDDFFLTYLLYDELPTSGERDQIKDFLETEWGLY